MLPHIRAASTQSEQANRPAVGDIRPAAMNGGVKSVYGAPMKSWLLPILLSVCVFAALTPANAKNLLVETVIQCQAADDDMEPPNFDGEDCKAIPYWKVDPQGRHLWIEASVQPDQALLASNKPLGFYIFGKTSSEVYLNGRLLGRNGFPAATKQDETPGRMDAVFLVSRDALIGGENVFAIRMSAHHGFVHFRYPLQRIVFGEYADPTFLILDAYWPSLIPFGALVAGFLYFAAASVTAQFRPDNTLLALVSFFAASQLFTEIYRGLVPYLYPVHDWRMILVVLFSAGFGLCLAGHVIERYLTRRRGLVFGFVTLAAAAGIILAPGFDGKGGLAILIPAIVSASITGLAAYRRRPFALVYFITLSLFAATVVIFPDRFLDTIFFYEVAALLLVLFVAQAFALARERTRLEDEQTRSRQLALTLERANETDAVTSIKISGAGKIDVVAAQDIAHCKGAGDYVEICLKDGREILHNGSLSQLEGELPTTFLRVHRSYLVNTDYVRSLTRKSSGVGALRLTTDAEIPVSRRIMPKVRSALI
ncbi:MAG: LytTR family DNA-binding domain-containing protein [Pseudomonadota bacterium]